jgi:hypothetical protein
MSLKEEEEVAGMEEELRPLSPGWSVLEALSVIIIVFAAGIFIPFKKMSWFKFLAALVSPDNPLLGQVFWSGIVQGGLFIVLIAYFLRSKYLPWSRVGLISDEEKRWFWTGLKQGVVLFILVVILGIIITILFPIKVEPQPIAEIIMSARSFREMLLPLFVAAVMAPISEELYFRGFLYPALKNWLGRIPALLIASSFFGLVHFDLIRFIPITLGGIWLTLLYEQTGSLYTSITAHAVWNTLMVLLIFWGANIGA